MTSHGIRGENGPELVNLDEGSATLWIPPSGIAHLRMRPRKKTITLPDGTRALVTIDDSETVKQIETTERLDAVVRPRSVKIQIRKQH